MQININENEYWWGISVSEGYLMPFGKSDIIELIITGSRENDQFSPLLVSSDGRYLYGGKPFSVNVANGIITTDSDAELDFSEGHETLRGAYLAAMMAHFPFTGELPDEFFFRSPQYNTCIELGTNQTSESILRYAHGILENGLPAGILMIDGGWQEDYGTFEFHLRKIPDPNALIDELHTLGFKVMLWVSPIVSSAGQQFKMIRDRHYLIREPGGRGR
jgi:alpha-glucosidase